MKEKILAAIIAELTRQSDVKKFGAPFIGHLEDLDCVTIDGYVDLEELAEAVIKALAQPDHTASPTT